MSTAPIENEPSVRPCKGGCGRMTRPNNTRAIPGMKTVTRANALLCYSCNRSQNPNVKEAEERKRVAAQQEKERRQIAAFREKDAFLARRQERMAAAAQRELAAMRLREHAVRQRRVSA